MLNKTEGEILGSWGRGVVAPVDRWASVMGMLEVATAAVTVNFAARGVPTPIRFEVDSVSVQEYHLFDSVVFIFHVRHNGVDLYDTYKFKLGLELRQELALTGKWPALFAMPVESRGH